MIRLTPSKKNFRAGVANAKMMGCKFDPAAKVWTRSEEALWSFVDRCKRADQTRESYLQAKCLYLVESTPVSASQSYQGQASMDAAESHF